MKTTNDLSLPSAAGTVVREESNAGLGDVLVTLYDITSSTEAGSPLGADAVHLKHAWFRIASVLTSRDGSFSISYGPGDLQRSSGPIDLAIVVSAPERSSSVDGQDEGHIATFIRRRAGRTETFLVLANENQLRRAGYRAWKEHDYEQVIARRQRAAQRQAAIAKRQAALDQESRRSLAQKLDRATDSDRKAEQMVSPLLNTLSGVPPDSERLITSRHVPRGENILEHNRRAIEAGITTFQTMSMSVDIPSIAELDAAKYELPASARRPTWSRRPFKALCWEDTGPVDECVRLLQGKEPPTTDAPTPDPEEPEAPPAQLLATADVPQFVSRLTQDLRSPEFTPLVNPYSPQPEPPKTRANSRDIEQRVSSLQLHTGPADVPAVYDFHRLRIAFEDVWMELFDGKLRQAAMDLYTHWVNLGGPDPTVEVICNYLNNAEKNLKQVTEAALAAR